MNGSMNEPTADDVEDAVYAINDLPYPAFLKVVYSWVDANRPQHSLNTLIADLSSRFGSVDVGAPR